MWVFYSPHSHEPKNKKHVKKYEKPGRPFISSFVVYFFTFSLAVRRGGIFFGFIVVRESSCVLIFVESEILLGKSRRSGRLRTFALVRVWFRPDRECVPSCNLIILSILHVIRRCDSVACDYKTRLCLGSEWSDVASGPDSKIERAIKTRIKFIGYKFGVCVECCQRQTADSARIFDPKIYSI